jgi:hypothetical protein
MISKVTLRPPTVVFKGEGEAIVSGTRARAHRVSEWTGGWDLRRRDADNKIVVATGRWRRSVEARQRYGVVQNKTERCYQVKFDGGLCWFDRCELAVLPDRIADLSNHELETQFLEAEQYALEWASIGTRSVEHHATRWMVVAGELRAEIARRGRGEAS